MVRAVESPRRTGPRDLPRPAGLPAVSSLRHLSRFVRLNAFDIDRRPARHESLRCGATQGWEQKRTRRLVISPQGQQAAVRPDFGCSSNPVPLRKLSKAIERLGLSPFLLGKASRWIEMGCLNLPYEQS